MATSECLSRESHKQHQQEAVMFLEEDTLATNQSLQNHFIMYHCLSLLRVAKPLKYKALLALGDSMEQD